MNLKYLLKLLLLALLVFIIIPYLSWCTSGLPFNSGYYAILMVNINTTAIITTIYLNSKD